MSQTRARTYELSAESRPDEPERSVRPLSLAEFIGQRAARKNLKVFIEAAKTRGEALDHVLFVGPPGLGKTTLAQIVARELGVNFRSTAGPVDRACGPDLAARISRSRRTRLRLIDGDPPLCPAVCGIPPAMETTPLGLGMRPRRLVKIELRPNSPLGGPPAPALKQAGEDG